MNVMLQALGLPLQIEVGGEEPERLYDAVRRTWSACLIAPEDQLVEPPVLRVAVESGERTAPGDDEVVAPTFELVMELLTQRITVEAITAHAGELLMLHACAVADPSSGRAVVLVGPSGMGKTTAALTLGRRWGYVTDETAAITDDGGVLRYPKPLSLTSGGHGGKDQVAPGELGLARVEVPPRLARILLLDRRSDLVEPVVQPVRTVEAVALLAEHTSYLASMERPLRRIAALLHRTGGLLRVSYSEAASLEPVVERELGRAG